jgi:hypothetical protein
MLNILFVTFKFSESGTFNNIFNNIFETFDECKDVHREHLFIDELYRQGNHIDNVLISTINSTKFVIINQNNSIISLSALL